jgi:ribose transport system permease protein
VSAPPAVVRTPTWLTPPLIAFLLAVLLFLASVAFASHGDLGAVSDRALNILRISAFLGVIAAGQTIVIISGGEGIDLSVSAIVTLSAMLVGWIANKEDPMVPVALLAAMGVGGAIGLVNGLGVAFLGVHPLVMTLGIAGVTNGVMLAICRGKVRGGAGPWMMRIISYPQLLGLSGAVLVWAVVSVFIWVLLKRSRYGRNLFAVGVNREAARLSGVNVKATVILAYVLCGGLAAFGGFMLLGYTQTVYFTLGGAYLFPSIAAVVIGGTTLAGGQGS